MKKIIFGKVYEFTSDPEYQGLLNEALCLYKSATNTADVKVDITKYRKARIVTSSNPSLHQKTSEGMNTKFAPVEVHWGRTGSGSLAIDAIMPPQKSGVVGYLKKINSMEYPAEIETFEQILHELILVPSCYFFSDIAPIHAACVGRDSKAILLAGTGGVGKSSAMLTFRNHTEYEFVSDDISIIDGSGAIYGNMAWPKIYGYNCAGNSIKSCLLAGRGLLDKLHFNIRYLLNPSRVRRKIRPDKLFKKYQSGKVDIAAIYYLVKEKVDRIQVTKLDEAVAVDMSVSVMNAEYQIFHKFLDWENYNSLARQEKPVLSFENVLIDWRKVLAKAYSGIKIVKISIPLSLDHKEYQDSINALIRLELSK